MIKMSIYINILNIMSLSLNFKTIPKRKEIMLRVIIILRVFLGTRCKIIFLKVFV